MKRSIALILFLTLGLGVFAQDADIRGLKIAVAQLEGENAAIGRQYAVLIAIDKYKNWVGLRNPVKDAKEIKDILSERYFITDFIELYDQDATKVAIIQAVDIPFRQGRLVLAQFVARLGLSIVQV